MEKRERQEGITTGQAKGQTQRWQPLQPNLARVNEAARRSGPPRVLSEEPTAVTPHGGICGGESQQWLSYPTRIEIDGRPVVIDGAARAQALGIGTVFQELSLADSLSVAENIFVGRLPTFAGVIRWGELRRRAREILSALAIDVDVDRAVNSLPAGARQLVEIAKALSLQSRILLLDEPTSALTAEEVEALLSLIGRLKANGIGIVYVSHRLGEVFQIADRITVLRDGRKVSTRSTALTSSDAVVHDMVGHHLTEFVEASGEVGAVAVVARGLGRPGEFAEVDLTVRFGEIVGLAGLLGARRSELARTLVGILAPHHGSIEIRGHIVRLRSLRDAMRRGVAYVPEERKTDGLFLTRSVSDNLAVAALARFTRVGLLDGRAMRIAAERTLSRFHVRAPGLDAEAGRLSGGNQQKLMLGAERADFMVGSHASIRRRRLWWARS